MKIIDKIADILYKIVIIGIILFLLYWILQITTVCSFHTPSSSMSPTLLADESGLVNKWKMGARIFNVFDAMESKPYTIKRLPGYGKLDRGDVIVFNYPYLDNNKDSIAMNLGLYYCKRAVGVAGDTLEIRNGFYHVRGCLDTLGVASEQIMLRDYIREHSRKESNISKWPGWMKCNPKDSTIRWTIKDMGPFVIPAKGMAMEINHRNWLIYRRYIEWETGMKLEWKDSLAIMDENPIKFYKFTENYCFAAGDHVIDSRDSRYFGLVPEKFIVGTAGILWKSKDKKRIFKRLNIH